MVLPVLPGRFGGRALPAGIRLLSRVRLFDQPCSMDFST
jgi:hypothetical protein